MGFGDINSLNKLFDFLIKDVKFGFKSQDGKILIRNENSGIYYIDTLYRYYCLQSYEELLKNKVGLCYDHVEFMRYWFKLNNIDINTFYTNILNHSIMTYKLNEKYYWIETTLKNNYGIFEYDSMNKLLDNYIDRLIMYSAIKFDEIKLYYFDSVNYGCDFHEYIKSITSKKDNLILSKKIEID